MIRAGVPELHLSRMSLSVGNSWQSRMVLATASVLDMLQRMKKLVRSPLPLSHTSSTFGAAQPAAASSSADASTCRQAEAVTSGHLQDRYEGAELNPFQAL